MLLDVLVSGTVDEDGIAEPIKETVMSRKRTKERETGGMLGMRVKEEVERGGHLEPEIKYCYRWRQVG